MANKLLILEYHYRVEPVKNRLGNIDNRVDDGRRRLVTYVTDGDAVKLKEEHEKNVEALKKKLNLA